MSSVSVLDKTVEHVRELARAKERSVVQGELRETLQVDLSQISYIGIDILIGISSNGRGQRQSCCKAGRPWHRDLKGL